MDGNEKSLIAENELSIVNENEKTYSYWKLVKSSGWK